MTGTAVAIGLVSLLVCFLGVDGLIDPTESPLGRVAGLFFALLGAVGVVSAIALATGSQ